MGRIMVFFFGLGVVLSVLWVGVMTISAPIAGEKIAQGIQDVADSGALDKPEVLGEYTGIPLTNHALDGRGSQKWNAVTISEYFDTGGCTPKWYYCEADNEMDDYEVHYCEVNGGKSVGLIIGRAVRQIVTGFMANNSYWSDRCP